jgi:myosin-1
VREGIKWTPIQYFNNQIVVELIEGKVGMFSLLDDICFTIHAQSGSSTDLKFLEKLTGNFGSHPHYRAFNGAFQVKHYAGDVTYEVEGFSDKNKDTLFSDLVETVQCSSNQFLVNLFPENVSASAQKKRPTTAGFKIKVCIL